MKTSTAVLWRRGGRGREGEKEKETDCGKCSERNVNDPFPGVLVLFGKKGNKKSETELSNKASVWDWKQS